MATLKAVVRTARADGFYPVYIRVTHHRASSFIRTDKMVTKKELTKNNEIKDPFVLQYCSTRILEYNERLNRQDIENWTVKEVAQYLQTESEDISFSEYARKHIAKMINNGQQRNAKNYLLALQHLERFCGTTRVMFSHLTSHLVNRWIKSMEATHRAKEMYPICMRQVFKAAVLEYNDYDTGCIRIKTNPWIKVVIPEADKSKKLAITPEACREFFSFPLPESKMLHPLTEIGRDVAMMTLCLAGINTIDLYQMKKDDYYNGILHYRRAKTMKSRNDGAYFEIRVPEILNTIFDKYLSSGTGEWLFTFHDRFSTADSFNAAVNTGLKEIAKAMGPEQQRYCAYTFRHTWATIAQNDLHASIADVAFALNHSAGLKVTRGYLKIDFSPAWELNEKVIDFVFFSDASSGREKEQQQETDTHFKLSFRYMVKAQAYHQGKVVASIADIGYNNIEQVISKLASMLPDDIPDRTMITFRITNVDKGQTMVYQRQKGKGF